MKTMLKKALENLSRADYNLRKVEHAMKCSEFEKIESKFESIKR
jgi:hypothetical protein